MYSLCQYMKHKISKLLTSFIVLLIAMAGGEVSAQSSISIWGGVYSEQQALRGSEEYRARCASCHSVDLRGNSNSPSLLGMSFMFIWEGRSLGELFTKLSREMPTDAPGSLSKQSYTDILAYVLQANQFPVGQMDLTANEDTLSAIIIAAKAVAE